MDTIIKELYENVYQFDVIKFTQKNTDILVYKETASHIAYLKEHVVELAKQLCDSYALETLMFSFEYDLLLVYLFLCIEYNFFEYDLSEQQGIEIIKSLTGDLVRHLDSKNERNLSNRLIAIYRNMVNSNSKFKSIFVWGDIRMPWSLSIQSAWNYELYLKNKQQSPPVNETKENLYDVFNYVDLYAIASNIYNGNTSALVSTNILECYPKFGETLPYASMVNGTACVGKTTLLNQAISIINATIDPNATVLKLGSYGGFRGKDIDQVLAMSAQTTALDLVQFNYTSIMDRCITNNLIWRIIMRAIEFDEPEKFISVILMHITALSKSYFHYRSKYPVIIIIDTDVNANRERMFMRNEGQDIYRSKILNYVCLQNIVYGLFAKLCNWVIVDIGLCKTQEARNALYKDIKDLLVYKSRLNSVRKPVAIDTQLTFKSETIYDPNTFNDYSAATELRIFK